MNNEVKLIANNKKAYHDFFVEETIDAGIVLVGSEVKSIRNGGISLNDSFIYGKNNELFLKNTYIKPYEQTSSFIPAATRDRKLLLNKAEILKLSKKVKEKGFSLMPLKVFFKNNLVKIQIGLCKGKKLYDKRDALKEKSIKREIEQSIKFNR